jgi:hypothetical protein
MEQKLYGCSYQIMQNREFSLYQKDFIRLVFDKRSRRDENNQDIDLCEIKDCELLEMFESLKKVFCPTKWTHASSHNCRWKFLFTLFHDSSLEREIQKVLDYDMYI